MKQFLLIGIVALILFVGGGWVLTRQRASAPTSTDTMPHMPMDARPVQSHRSYEVLSSAGQQTYVPKTPSVYTFSVMDDQGNTLKDFATVHEKIMHVIVVRTDLAEFQHVHPAFNEETGAFTLTNLVFPSDGPYRIFADFTPSQGQKGPDGMPLGVTISEDITVGDQSTYAPQPLAKDVRQKTVGGYTVQLAATPASVRAQVSTTLSFALTRRGTLVKNLEPYLGALGHTVVLREGDLEFLHTHALNEDAATQTGTVDFAVTFPRDGMYKVFSQFQHAGKVLTTDFVVSVARGAATSTEAPADHQMMGH